MPVLAGLPDDGVAVPTDWRAVVTKTTDGYGKTYYDVARTRGTYRYRWTAPASTTLNAATGATLTLTVT